MIQVMSLQQPANGWFIPNCQDQIYFFADDAIEQIGPPDEVCSFELQDQRSQPLKKKNKDTKSAKQRIVPLDPLDDVPHPKGFPDGPPPKPSDPINDFLTSDDYFLTRDFFNLRPRAGNQRKSNKNNKDNNNNNNNRRKNPNEVVDDFPLLPQ